MCILYKGRTIFLLLDQSPVFFYIYFFFFKKKKETFPGFIREVLKWQHDDNRSTKFQNTWIPNHTKEIETNPVKSYDNCNQWFNSFDESWEKYRWCPISSSRYFFTKKQWIRWLKIFGLLSISFDSRCIYYFLVPLSYHVSFIQEWIRHLKKRQEKQPLHKLFGFTHPRFAYPFWFCPPKLWLCIWFYPAR